jgi:hypothetical protein
MTTSIPQIPSEPEADRVLVMRYGSTLDSSCILAGTAEVSDGRFGRDRAAYEGTFERASSALRNAAVAVEANVALIVDANTPLVVDSPGLRGYELGLTANLYRCENTAGLREPEPPPLRSLPSFEPH